MDPDNWVMLVPLMPLLGALPLAVAAVAVAFIWRRRRDRPVEMLEAQNAELREELEAVRRELNDAHERLDFTERLLTERGRPPEGRAPMEP
ncbi:MAG TPA: hypothetical protein VHJ69_07075 [Gemmatimonadales bacterium]|jgi:hypothetical protein|nr:hypothetical protein [Gemmatimonadales bacterium]